MTDETKVAALRDLIPATGAGIYLDTAYRGPLPAETAAAMREADDWELRVGRAAEGRDEDFAQKRDEARAVIAALIGASPDEIVLAPPPSGVPLHPLVDPETGAYDNRTAGLSLDATLAAGAVPLDVGSLASDLVYIRGDRWLLGPEGMGAAWVRSAAVRREMLDGDLGRTQVLGLARSVGWLEMYVGLDWIYERTARLATRLYASFSATEGVEVVTPRDALAAIVVFRLRAWPTSAALDELRRRVFAIVGGTPDGSALRASVAWFNTEDELDRFSAAIAEIARHTPESLPRRPPLIVR